MNKKLTILAVVFILVSFGLTYLFLSESAQKDFEIEKFSYVPQEHIEAHKALEATLPDGEKLTKFTPQYSSDAPEVENLELFKLPL
jgi:regulatory protein YycI of two-component signal transduction system YycFG